MYPRRTHRLIFLTLGMLGLVLLVIQELRGHTPSETSWTFGGQRDNWRTEFVGGDGAGSCSLQGMPNYWVNTATRFLVVEDTDHAYSGLGPAVSFVRTYNAPRFNGLAVPGGAFGANWIFSYESIVDYSGQSIPWEEPYVILRRGSGQGLRFEIDLSATPPVTAVPLPGNYDRLTWHGDYWLYWEKATRLTYRYNKVADSELSRLVSITDIDGNTVTVSYNADGTIGTITDAVGRSTSLTYNPQKYCTTLTLPDGRQASFEYDGDGNLVRSVDLQGAVSTFSYDQDHFMTSLNAAGKVTTFENEFGGEMKRLVDARGNEWSFASDWGVVLVTDPNGVEWSYSSGSDGWTSGKWNSLGNVFYRSYFGGNLTDFREGDGEGNWNSENTKSFTYDERGNLIQVRYRSGPLLDPNAPWINIYYTYDQKDNLLTLQDPLGNTWEFTYDQEQHLTRIRSPLGFETQLAYTAHGQLSALTDALGNITNFSHDSFGNLISITDALGTISTFGYDTSGLRRISSTDGLGNLTQYSYENNDRLTSVQLPDGSTRQHLYDCCTGTSTTNENGETSSFIRDSLLRPIQFIDKIGNIWAFSYDGNNNLSTVTDPLGGVVKRFYDESNRLVRSQDPLGQNLEFEYDPASNLSSVTDQRGKKTSFTYFRNLLKSASDPLGKMINYKHDLLDRVEQVTNARGQTVQVNYDADGRLVKRSYSGSASIIDYTYDAAGNLTSTKSGSGTTTYVYNSRYQVTKTTYPDGKEISMTYDAAGNVSSVTYPGGFNVNYQFDSRNLPTRAFWNGGSINLNYDAVGNILGISRSNSTASSYTFDKNNGLLSIQHMRQSEKWVDLQFTRDAVGNTSAESRLQPLFDVQDPGLTQATVNDTNQITQFGPESVEHDADGNLTRTGTRFSAVYDPENRPLLITQDGVSTAYAYDGLGNRVAAERGIWKRYFHYDHFGNLLFETDGDGKVTVVYIHVSGILLARRVGSDDTYYHFDSRGSTLALTDASGEVVAAYGYDTFGKVIHSSGSIYNPFTYVGAFGVMDEGDGLYFMSNRYYDASHQCFLQKDPIGYEGGSFNLYQYVGSNPVDWFDPLGLQRWDIEKTFQAEMHGKTKSSYSSPELNKAIETGSWALDKFLGYHPVTGTPWGVLTGSIQLARGKKADAFLRFMGAIPGYKQYKHIGAIYSGAADFTTLVVKTVQALPESTAGGGGVCAPPEMFHPVGLHR